MTDRTVAVADQGAPGLVERDRFTRAVDQADRDRDRSMVAVIAIEGLVEINLLCGYDVGDDLLGHLGRTLGGRASVDVTIGRIGGGRFGVLVTPVGERSPLQLIDPILADLDLAISWWLDDRAGLGTPSPIVPRAVAGLATGYGGLVWTQAEQALAVADTGHHPDPGRVRSFDPTDPRLAHRLERHQVIESLVDALSAGQLPLTVAAIDPLASGSAATPRVRVSLGPSVAGREPISATDLGLAPGLGARIDRELLAQALRLVDDRTDLTVSLVGPAPPDGWPLAPNPGQPGRPGPRRSIELPQDRLIALGADQRGRLARDLTAAGWTLTVSEFDGGWQAWAVVEDQPVEAVRLRADLVAAAIAGPIGSHVLAATMDGLRLTGRSGQPPIDPIAPAGAASGDQLRQLGFSHIDRSPPTGLR